MRLISERERKGRRKGEERRKRLEMQTQKGHMVDSCRDIVGCCSREDTNLNEALRTDVM